MFQRLYMQSEELSKCQLVKVNVESIYNVKDVPEKVIKR